MKLNYRILGSGKPVIVLHGVFGSSDNWQTVGKQLAENYKVYLTDLRNHGSSPHSDEMNYKVMADDIAELLKDESLASAFLVGHSMGGKVAMTLAANHPELVEKLVVVDIAPKYYPPHHQTILEAFKELDLDSVESRKDADEALAKKIDDPGVRQFILKNLGRSDQNKYEWKLNHQAIEQNIDPLGEGMEKGARYDGPVLFIKGSKSEYITREDEQLIKGHFPQADIKTVEGAGHWVHAEKPEETFKCIADFLS